MKRIILILCCIMLYSTVNSQIPANDPHWGSAEWIDDFTQMSKIYDSYDDGWYLTKTGNDKLWEVVRNFDHYGEPQVYLEQNTTINSTDGVVLQLERVQNVTISNAYDCGTGSGCQYRYHEFSSGQINSWDDRKINFGYLEAEIKVSDEYGLFPAFWLLSTNSQHEEEIDIFEMIPGTEVGMESTPLTNFPIYNPYIGRINDEFLMTSNIHKFNPSYQPNANYDPDRFDEITYTDLQDIGSYTDFHKYAVEWSSDRIIYYVDGKIIKNVSNPFDLNQDKGIVLNLALASFTNWSGSIVSERNYEEPPFGGQVHGSEDYPWTENYYDQTNFSNAKMTIKNISYYKLDMSDCSIPVTYMTTAQFDNHDNKIKYTIIIDGGATNIISSSSSPKVLRASNGVTIDNEFEVPLGVELYIDVSSCY